MSTTRINDLLQNQAINTIPNDERITLLPQGETPPERKMTGWQKMQATHKFTTAFCQNFYTLSSYLTALLEVCNLPEEKELLSFRMDALLLSIPLATLFAYSEAYMHQAESAYVLAENARETKKTMTWKEKFWTGVHYISGIHEGVMPLLAVSNTLGLNKCPLWQRIPTYAGMTLFSILGTKLELDTALITLRHKAGI